MNIEQEYKDAKLNHECLGMQNIPNDPKEALELDIRYKKAQRRYLLAEKSLKKMINTSSP